MEIVVGFDKCVWIISGYGVMLVFKMCFVICDILAGFKNGMELK